MFSARPPNTCAAGTGVNNCMATAIANLHGKSTAEVVNWSSQHSSLFSTSSYFNNFKLDHRKLVHDAAREGGLAYVFVDEGTYRT